MTRLMPLLLAAVSLAAFAAPSLSEDRADLLLQHGVFYPVHPPGRVEGSLAVRGGRIVYLGPDAGAQALRGPATRVIDLHGRAVTPGLIDAHSHFLGLGESLEEVDLTGAPTYEEVISRVKAAARDLPPGAWVRGRGWDQNRWPGKQFPTQGPLSAAVPDHPVWLERVDGHAALGNARALEIWKIDKTTADPPGGRLLRDASGAPAGVLVDRAQGLAHLPEPTPEDLDRRLRRAARHCLAVGLTTVTDMGISQPVYEAYAKLHRAGQLPLRAALFLTDDEALLKSWFARGPEIDPQARLTVRGVKMYADGALGSRGAALLAPYSDDPGNSGLLVSRPDHIEAWAETALRRGFQVNVHAIGDRGNRIVLDAFDSALKRIPKADHRFRIEHAQVVSPQDIPRFAKLGVIPSMQPTHQTSDMRWAEARVGPQRIRGAYAWRSLLNTGVVIPSGTDFPVEEVNPLLTFHAAVTRQDPANLPAGG